MGQPPPHGPWDIEDDTRLLAVSEHDNGLEAEIFFCKYKQKQSNNANFKEGYNITIEL